MDGKMSPITHVRCRQSLIKTRQFQLRHCGVMWEDYLVTEHGLRVSGKLCLGSV